LAALLSSLGAEAHVLDEPAHLVSGLPEQRLQVLLLESPLPSELDQVAAECPVLVLDDHGAAGDASWSHGVADALLSKNASLGELSLAIRKAIEGGPADELAGLTGRQREVLQLLAEGLDNAEIAERLGISPRTARAHVSGVLRQLGVSNRTQAAVAAVKAAGAGPFRSWSAEESREPAEPA
jgi:DNA-binding CsgD family transcriptional regulator